MNREINTNRISFLNTYIDNLTAEEAKKAVDQFIQADGFHYVVTPNSDIVVKMQDDSELKEICDNADLILIAGGVKRAPMWMQKAGLEWFFRFLQEPGRMWRRYFVDDMRIFNLARNYKGKK